MKPLRVLALPKYGRQGASSRMRTLQYLPWLAASGLEVTVQSLLDDEQLQHRYDRGRYDPLALLCAYASRVKALWHRQAFDLVWIEKESMQWWPLWAELALLRRVPFVLDYDDAVFHHYDMHRLKGIRRLFGRRIDGLMAQARLVVAGNAYLAQRARDAGARWVEVVPTVIDLDRYPPPQPPATGQNRAPTVVWIGSPSTVHYLKLIAEPLQALARRRPFVLRVIGGGAIDLPGVQVEVLPWSEGSEVDSIRSAQVGVMPLEDSPWERGKCGYKLIQYMACGLPVVGSAVGANNDIVVEGVTGFLAQSPQDWLTDLDTLMTDGALCERMGQAGRARVEDLYCIQETGPRMAQLLAKAAREAA